MNLINVKLVPPYVTVTFMCQLAGLQCPAVCSDTRVDITVKLSFRCN